MTKIFNKYFYLVILILSANRYSAQNIYQNLIPNGSFEKMKSFNYDSFPNLSLQDTNWIEYFGGNALFSSLYSPISILSSIPKNYTGYQYPQKGNNYYALVEYGNSSKCPFVNNYRSYAQIKLQKKVRKKKCVVYYISA
jgi:hypothetical protein